MNFSRHDWKSIFTSPIILSHWSIQIQPKIGWNSTKNWLSEWRKKGDFKTLKIVMKKTRNKTGQKAALFKLLFKQGIYWVCHFMQWSIKMFNSGNILVWPRDRRPDKILPEMNLYSAVKVNRKGPTLPACHLEANK